MYVVCFYWEGERWQTIPQEVTDQSFKNHLRRVGPLSNDLVVKYITNLYLAVSRWATIPFSFICFTNAALNLPQGIQTRPLQLSSRRGVLPRLYMFSEQAGLFGHQVLSLDLDIVITGSLKDIMNYRGEFCTRRSFTRGEETLLDGDIMSFAAGKETQKKFWTPFTENVKQAEQITQGRERLWIRYVTENEADTWDDITPKQVVSYKHHVQKQGLNGARIVSCHGHPRPHQINEPWIKEYWR